MRNIRTIIDKLQAFDFGQELEDIVRDNGDKLADLLVGQLAQGKRGDGKEINPPYSPFTVAEKKKKSGLAGVSDYVTFYDTGETYRALQTMVKSKTYFITANTFKWDKAIKRSGQQISKLSLESRTDFGEHVTLPEIKKRFKDNTGIGS